MDAFSEVLSGVKLKGALFFSAEFSAPWALATPASKALASALAPGAPHLVVYHLVVDGVARAALPDGRTLTLEPGDIVVFPHGDPHELSSASGAQHVDRRLADEEDRQPRSDTDAHRWWRRQHALRLRLHGV